MSRSAVRLLQQTLEALSISGGGTAAISEFLTAHSNSTQTEITVLTGSFNVYGLGISNVSGSSMDVVWGDSTSTNVLHMGSIANNDQNFVGFSPHFINFSTSILLKKTNTGSVRWTVFYHNT
jgi:hypothetical protein